MIKPVPRKREAIMSYHEMISFVEQKYNIQVGDYRGLFGTKDKESHFAKYQRITRDLQPNDGFYPDYSGKGTTDDERRTIVRDGKRIKAIQEEYDADFKLIHEQYQRYKDWSKDNPEPEYLDYWHWLIDNHFIGVHNGCNMCWGIKEIIDDEYDDEIPAWVKEITQKVYDEFKDELDEDGSIEVEISW